MTGPEDNYEMNPVRKEEESKDFDAALDDVRRLVFTIGSFFEGYERRIYTVSDVKVLFDLEHTLRQKPSNLPMYYPFTKDDFIAGLKGIRIGEWKKNYTDPYVSDGTQWELEIYFDNEREPVKISGSNAFPYNFSDLTKLLGVDEENEEDEYDKD